MPADKDERAALIRRLREGQCADNMGCGTMKMCVCANATDAADYLEKLAAVPECGRRFDLAASLKELRDRWASIVESQNWGDQFDGDFTTLDELHAHLTGAENCPDGEAVSGCGTTNAAGQEKNDRSSSSGPATPAPAAPTPRTDALVGNRAFVGLIADVVALARQLERELAAARSTRRTLTDEQIADGVAFIMGPGGDEGTRLCTCGKYPHLPTCGDLSATQERKG